MVDWAAARAFTEEACAGVFDVTPCTLTGMKAGLSLNHPETVDADRPAFGFLGTVDLQPPSDILRRANPSDPGVRGDTVSYAAVLSARVTDWPWRPVPRDRLTVGGKTYRIEASEKDGSDRPAYYLSEVRHVVG